jgi:hypothetical protein
LHDQSGRRGTSLHHAPDIDAVHLLASEFAGASIGRAEDVADADRLDIGAEIRLEIVGAGSSCRLPPFSCSRTHQRFAFGVVVLEVHRDGRAGAGKAAGHQRDQRVVAQPDKSGDIDAVGQRARLRPAG